MPRNTPSKRELAAERRLNKAFDELLKACMAEAHARGIKDLHNFQVYFESESGLVVLDGNAHDERENARHDRVLLTLPWPAWIKGHVDVGAW